MQGSVDTLRLLSPSEATVWLESSLGLEKHLIEEVTRVLLAEKLNGNDLIHMDDADFEEAGISSPEVRAALLHAVEQRADPAANTKDPPEQPATMAGSAAEQATSRPPPPDAKATEPSAFTVCQQLWSQLRFQFYLEYKYRWPRRFKNCCPAHPRSKATGGQQRGIRVGRFAKQSDDD